MRKIVARGFVVALLALVVGSTGASATPSPDASGTSQAPPSKIDSEPAEGAELHQAPDKVSITFDQPLDPSSQISVENHCGARADDRHTRVTGNSMEVDLGSDFAGTYHVSYFAKGVGGVTGQQSGAFTFSVHMGPSCDGKDHDHDKKKHKKKKHGPGHDDRKHKRGRDHDDHDPGSDHDGDTHATSSHGDDHSNGGGDHAGAGHAGGRHGDAHGRNHDSGGGGTEANGIRDLAGGPTGPPLRGPDLPAVAMSLGLCMLMGVLGGAVLRMSSPR